MTSATLEEKTKKRKKGGEAASPPPATEPAVVPGPWDGWSDAGIAELPVVQVAVGQMLPHPANRVVGQAEIDEIAQSIARHGQLEPCLVRPWKDAVQILSGETRWRASIALGKECVPCRICEVDDARALLIVAEANAQRKDLTTIQKAELIRRLCLAVDAGGSGLTREAAAKIYRLQSGSAASNLLKLLQAPAAWKTRLDNPDLNAAGEEVVIHQATVREIARYAHVPAIVEALEAEYDKERKSNDLDYFRTREQQLEWLDNVIDDSTRRLTGKIHYGYQLGGEHPCYLDLTDANLRQQLNIVTIPRRSRRWVVGKEVLDETEVEVATNVKLFDSLQEKEIKARQKAGKGAAKEASQSSAAAKLSPAEQKKIDREKRKKQDMELRNWVHSWRYRMLRRMLGEDLSRTSEERGIMVATILAKAGFDWRASLEKFIQAAALDQLRVHGEDIQALKRHDTVIERLHDHPTKDSGYTLLHLAARFILWPHDESGTLNSTVLSTDPLPEHMPHIDDEVIDQLCSVNHFTFVNAWQDAAVDGSVARAQLVEFLERHTTAQLFDLAEELRENSQYLDVSAAKKKPELVEAILNAHLPGRMLVVPAICKAPESKSKKSRA